MSGFRLRHQTPAAPGDAWVAVTDWSAHSRLVPFTTIWAEGPDRVIARTRIGPLRFDDVMQVRACHPPAPDRGGRLELVKTGPVHGWATIEVVANGTGSTVSWAETARIGPSWFRGLTGALQDAVGRVAFGRLLRRLLSDAEPHPRSAVTEPR